MSRDAMLPCLVCGATLQNAFDEQVNQPSEGTEFETYGHYGSTFWDSFDGEQIVINICDECLRKNTGRIARRKAFRKIVVWSTHSGIRAMSVVGRQWVYHELVPWFEGHEYGDDEIGIEVEEIGVLDRKGEGGYDNIEWVRNWRDIKISLLAQRRADEGETGGCKHVRHIAECLDCGASPLEGLR